LYILLGRGDIVHFAHPFFYRTSPLWERRPFFLRIHEEKKTSTPFRGEW